MPGQAVNPLVLQRLLVQASHFISPLQPLLPKVHTRSHTESPLNTICMQTEDEFLMHTVRQSSGNDDDDTMILLHKAIYKYKNVKTIDKTEDK